MPKSEHVLPHRINKIASHVPNLVVYEKMSKDLPYTEHFHGVLLFADISGFTALTERFSRSSKKGYGADQLTKTLNKYISEIVNHILIAGGDILNFAGDAMLALWKVHRSDLREVITLAVKCSLNIQDQCDNRETDVGVKLRVKIGISAGKLSKVLVGNEEFEYFVVVGHAVDEVRIAEGLALANTIILSTNAWELCDRDTIAIHKIENERSVKVRYIKRESSFSIEEYLTSTGSHLEHEPNANYALRKASKLLPNPELEATLAKYLMSTVLKKIDDDQPLEYLSEIRPVTTVFVNLQFKEDATIHHQCSSMQDATLHINAVFKKYQGRTNKIFMFDKGCTFLCVFGLPGDKREDECAHALQCALKVQTFCANELFKIKSASVGVTYGPAFCGVIGHPLRHEYTVIGAKVNLAARLMMHYPGVVSCGQDAYQQAKLPSYYFSELPKKAMKGIINPGPIYRYLGKKQQKLIVKTQFFEERDEDYPILGREKELKMFDKALNTTGPPNYNVVMYEGAMGYGKSKVLAEICYKALSEGFRAISFELAKIDIKQPYYTIQSIMALLLQIENCKSYAEREKVIQSKITDEQQQDNLCLLNSLLLVKFIISQKVSLMDSEQKLQVAKKFIIEIINQILKKEAVIFVIDQAHYIDTASWDIIMDILNSTPALFVLALQPFTHGNPHSKIAANIIMSTKTLYVKLEELDPSVIPQLACSILGVLQIPKVLEILLVERSRGVPFFCVELLKSLYFSNIINIEPVEEEEEDEIDVLFNIQKLTSEVWKQKIQRRNAEGINSMSIPLSARRSIALEKIARKEELFECTISEAVKLQNIPIPLTIKGMALAQLDQMNPAEQMVVKCAAIIGHTFSTKMLQYILPEGATQKLNQTLESLLRRRMFECASMNKKNLNPILAQKGNSQFMTCHCPEIPEEHINKPHGKTDENADVTPKENQREWRCRIMSFCMPFVQETAYELWLKEQKKELHQKCTVFLEHEAHRCNGCGGGSFIFAHQLAAGFWTIKDSTISNTESQLDSHAEPIASSQTVQNTTQDLYQDSEEFNTEEDHPSRNNINKMPKYPKSPFKIPVLFKSKIRRRQVAPTPDTSKDVEFFDKLDSVIGQCTEEPSLHSKDCECADIIESVIAPLARHWMGVGDQARALYYLLETAAGALSLSNSFMALSYLLEATNIIEQAKRGNISENGYAEAKVKICKFDRACVFSLKGEVYFHMGNISDSKHMFGKALKLLNRKLPQNIIHMSLKYVSEKMKNAVYHRFSIELPDHASDKRIAYMYEQIHCLSFLWQTYCMKASPKAHESASLATMMEVNSAELTSNELKVIQSYIDYFRCCQIMGNIHQFRKYEILAVEKCVQVSHSKEGILMIGYLAQALATVKLCFGQLSDSIEYGQRALKVAMLLNKPSLDFILIPVLSKALFLSNRYSECVSVLIFLEETAVKNHNILAKAWFYAACLDILLQGGFALKSFEECLDFFSTFQTDPVLMAEKRLMLSLHSSFALWFARLQEWDLFRTAFRAAKKLVSQTHASCYAMHGYATFLECQVLVLSKAAFEESDSLADIYQKTTKQFKDFMRRCITSPVYYARLFHLQAYVCLLFDKEKTGCTLLQKALESCKRHGNKLEESWIELSNEAWFGKELIEDSWLKSALKLPSWDEARNIDMSILLRTKYILKCPTNAEDTSETESYF